MALTKSDEEYIVRMVEDGLDRAFDGIHLLVDRGDMTKDEVHTALRHQFGGVVALAWTDWWGEDD